MNISIVYGLICSNVNLFQIAVLDDAVSKVKSEHSRLENTLEYLKTQQQEFEAFLEPLEASLPATISADPDRENL